MYNPPKIADYHMRNKRRKEVIPRETFGLDELSIIKYVMRHYRMIADTLLKEGKIIIEIETTPES